MNCPQCDREVSTDAAFCSGCGKDLRRDCPGCGQAVIGRDWYVLTSWGLTDDGACRHFGTAIAGVFQGDVFEDRLSQLLYEKWDPVGLIDDFI